MSSFFCNGSIGEERTFFEALSGKQGKAGVTLISDYSNPNVNKFHTPDKTNYESSHGDTNGKGQGKIV